MRQHLEGAAILGEVRARCYFGEPTPIGEGKRYLERPDAGRLFFISPPPSPPIGWEMKHEEPPNKEVHAEDLADALARLGGKLSSGDNLGSGVDSSRAVQYSKKELQAQHRKSKPAGGAAVENLTASPGRSRSSTVVIYDPGTHGDSSSLPAVMVEDFTADDDDDHDLRTQDERPKITTHTSRPPVELMEGS